jgi:hypothetical protein
VADRLPPQLVVGREVLARDWTVSAIATFQSGTPLTIAAGTDRNFDGLTNDRADLAGNPELDHGRPIDQLIEGWFNVAAFAVPVVGTDGNSGRNIIDGPGVRNVDLGIFRDIPLKGPIDVPVPPRGDERVQHRQLEQPGDQSQRPRDVRQDPEREKYAPDSTRRSSVVLMGSRREAISLRETSSRRDDLESPHWLPGVAGRGRAPSDRACAGASRQTRPKAWKGTPPLIRHRRSKLALSPTDCWNAWE